MGAIVSRLGGGLHPVGEQLVGCLCICRSRMFSKRASECTLEIEMSLNESIDQSTKIGLSHCNAAIHPPARYCNTNSSHSYQSQTLLTKDTQVLPSTVTGEPQQTNSLSMHSIGIMMNTAMQQYMYKRRERTHPFPDPCRTKKATTSRLGRHSRWRLRLRC